MSFSPSCSSSRPAGGGSSIEARNGFRECQSSPRPKGEPLTRLVVVVASVTLLNCDAVPTPSSTGSLTASEASASKGAEKDEDCGSQRLATVQLGEALAHVRAARIFASREQRLALAHLEGAIVSQIEAEPDSNFRGAAWLQVDAKVIENDATRALQRIQRREERWLGRGIDAQVVAASAASREQEYDSHMNAVVRAVDPRAPHAPRELA